jgi:hypothetical protein
VTPKRTTLERLAEVRRCDEFVRVSAGHSRFCRRPARYLYSGQVGRTLKREVVYLCAVHDAKRPDIRKWASMRTDLIQARKP